METRVFAEIERYQPDKHVHIPVFTLHAVHHGDSLGIPAAGKEHTISETHIFYVKHGKVTEHWRDADLLGMMRQLGAIPAPEKK